MTKRKINKELMEEAKKYTAVSIEIGEKYQFDIATVVEAFFDTAKNSGIKLTRDNLYVFILAYTTSVFSLGYRRGMEVFLKKEKIEKDVKKGKVVN